MNAHVNNIMMLPTIQSANPAKVKAFFEKLISSVEALETMGKLQEIKGNVRMTLDKLPGIRADLVRLDNDWKSWGFVQVVEALGKSRQINEERSAHEYKDKRLEKEMCILREPGTPII